MQEGIGWRKLSTLHKTIRNPPCFSRQLRDSKTETARRFYWMLKVKDTLRATVHLSFDGRVFKAYHGPKAQERFDNEVRVLKHLAARGCGLGLGEGHLHEPVHTVRFSMASLRRELYRKLEMM